MTLEQQNYQRRLQEFPLPIVGLSQHNPIVHSLMQLYANGTIITMNECLLQMVVALARHAKSSDDILMEQVKLGLYISPVFTKA